MTGTTHLVERVTGLDPPDRGACLDLWVRAWTTAWPGLDFEARRGWLTDHLDGLVARGAVLLLVRGPGGAPCGFLTVDPSTGAVDQLAVDPGVAGQGIGRLLIAEAKRLSPGRLVLTVNQGNARAVRVYERAGFVVTGEGVNPRSLLPVWTMTWTAPR